MKQLDSIITSRKSVRSFNGEAVSKEKIEAIIEAGRQAPYAGLAQAGVEEFRHFFVIHKDSEIANPIKLMVQDAREKDLNEALKKQYEKSYSAYVNMLKNTKELHGADIFSTPWLVIIAERGGIPVREEICLGYVLENMWLKATSMDIDFKICSVIGDIKKKDELKNLLGLSKDESYAFDACNMGYAAENVLRDIPRKMPLRSIRYFE